MALSYCKETAQRSAVAAMLQKHENAACATGGVAVVLECRRHSDRKAVGVAAPEE